MLEPRPFWNHVLVAGRCLVFASGGDGVSDLAAIGHAHAASHGARFAGPCPVTIVEASVRTSMTSRCTQQDTSKQRCFSVSGLKSVFGSAFFRDKFVCVET